ncbi:MAG TPA: hypothetical protein VHC90_26275 [Bryobacteraceae bacterium]|nr:hypothetical protein [Bryobacteraceae bacterium]
MGTYPTGIVQIQLEATGATPLTWSVANGSNLPPGLAVGQSYNFPFHVLNGIAPTISLNASLAQGLGTMTVTGGALSGMPSSPGSYQIPVKVVDGAVPGLQSDRGGTDCVRSRFG